VQQDAAPPIIRAQTDFLKRPWGLLAKS
jgi:hypothetical protein